MTKIVKKDNDKKRKNNIKLGTIEKRITSVYNLTHTHIHT